MATSKSPIPGPTGNVQPSAESPWPGQATSPDDVPGMPPRERDPRSLSQGTKVQAPIDNSYPGAGVPGEPLVRAPAPSPSRLRRDA